MKYPEYRLSMEAALPSSVHTWLKCELEQRGIDSLVYTRYIISLLLQNEDLDLDCDADLFCPAKSSITRKGRKLEKKKLSISDEERKKTAAIECLADLYDEKSDIKSLIDELCLRLKDSEAQATVSPVVKSHSSSSDNSEDSGTENQNSTERYYAAFPSLHGKVSPSSSTSSSITSVAVESVWKNNPLVKPVSSTDEGSSSNDDLEVKKINKVSSVTYTKPKKTRKNTSQNRDHPDQRKGKSSSNKSRHHGHQSSKHESFKKDPKMVAWPPGFAKLDPLLQTSYDTFDDEICELRTETPKRPNEDLCTKVECILKGMLLPAPPEKTYKELQDVDNEVPDEQKQRSNVAAENFSSGSSVSACGPVTEKTEDPVQEIEEEVVPREASVSPELQEQEIWYTQPIGEIFQSPDEESSSSKLRLYKRNSYPLFSPESNDGKTGATDCVDSSASSPVFDRSRSYSASSNDSENILEGSVYMPSWLTEEISADQNEEMSAEMQQAYLSTSFNASSPLGNDVEADCQFAKNLECTLTTEDFGWGEATCSVPSSTAGLSLEIDLYNPWSVHSDENLTPTPDEAKSLESESCTISGPLSVSLVDWDYLSQFLCESDWAAFHIDEGLKKSHPQRTCLSSLSQNQVVVDISLDVQDYSTSPLGMFGIYWWQPFWNEESALSQLWDVNMQKRPKLSPWGCPSFLPVSQVWVTENTFVFYNGGSSEQDGSNEIKENENTLIPRISIDLLAEPSLESMQNMDKSEEEVDDLRRYFDRSISLVDVPTMWDEADRAKGPNPKLSKSFELVPSETSAFCDVPRRLIHVHSEPNLVQFRQEFTEGSQSKQHSPQEHLYFSPKTHFRPITPAFAPELCMSKIKQQVCHDLFGGLPTTKTPYQQFHNYEDVSDEDSFIPRFKVKNYCKSIQTGDAEEKVQSPAASSDTGDRDTPQTLTLGMIEDIMGEKDDADSLLPISEDLDTANTDSAYETDYGLSAIDSEQDDAKQPHSHCIYGIDSNSNAGNQVNTSVVDHGNLGDRMDYSIESFMATFPHTQDWPDISQSCHISSGHSQWSDNDDGQLQMASSWPQPHVYPDRSADTYHHDSQDMYLMDSHDSWMTDLFSDHQYNDGEADPYKNIWASGDQDSSDIAADAYPFDLSNFNDEFDGQLVCGESSPHTGYGAESSDCLCYDGEAHQTGEAVQCSEHRDNETDLLTAADAVGSGVDTIPVTVSGGEVEWTNPGDYFSVQLVYKDKQSVEDPDNVKCQKSYGNFDLMPMPGEAVLSTELEKEWMHPNAVLYKPSCLQRKPCSFYLEGNCRRADCKFAHDISNITCRFWEEGDCFKGPLCPFLHGYPRVTSPTAAVPVPGSDSKDKFSLTTEEFPELALTVKNGNTTSTKRVGKAIKGASTATKRDRSRKSNRRYSNKENKMEARLMEKCSSSV